MSSSSDCSDVTLTSSMKLSESDENECNCQFNSPCAIWPFGDLYDHENKYIIRKSNPVLIEIGGYIRRRHRYIFRNLISSGCGGGCFESSLIEQNGKIIPCLIITVPDLNLAQNIPSHVCTGKYSNIIGLDKVSVYIREGNVIPA